MITFSFVFLFRFAADDVSICLGGSVNYIPRAATSNHGQGPRACRAAHALSGAASPLRRCVSFTSKQVFFCCCPALLSSLLLLFITHQSFLSVRACVRAPWRRTFALPLRRVYLNGAGTPLLPCEVRHGETVFRDGEKGCKRERRCKSGPGQPRWNAGIVSSSPLSFRQIRRCRSASPFAGRSL